MLSDWLKPYKLAYDWLNQKNMVNVYISGWVPAFIFLMPRPNTFVSRNVYIHVGSGH